MLSNYFNFISDCLQLYLSRRTFVHKMNKFLHLIEMLKPFQANNYIFVLFMPGECSYATKFSSNSYLNIFQFVLTYKQPYYKIYTCNQS